MDYALNEMFPSDSVECETEVHKTIRQYTEQSPNTNDDLDFTENEINQLLIT